MNLPSTLSTVVIGVAALTALLQTEATAAAPAGLISSIRAVSELASASAAAGTAVTRIAEGVMRMMFLSKVKAAVAGVGSLTAAIALCCVSVGLLARDSSAARTADETEATLGTTERDIDGHVAANAPTASSLLYTANRRPPRQATPLFVKGRLFSFTAVPTA